jgi:hypothetical protein
MAWNIRPEGRYSLISSGLPGLTPSENGTTTLVFPFFPVGRAKFLFQRNLDAAHISPGEICGLVPAVLRWPWSGCPRRTTAISAGPEPVPEPSIYALLAVAAVGCGAHRLRRRLRGKVS